MNLDSGVYIYGNGTFGRSVAKNLIENGINIVSMIDLNIEFERSAIEINGEKIKIITPEKADVTKTIILGIHNPYVDISKISEYLQSMGFSSIISPVQIFNYFKTVGISSENYWLNTSYSLDEEETAYEKFMKNLEDKYSKNLLAKIKNYRLNGYLGDIPTPLPVSEQYFPNDIPGYLEEDVILVDCGAYPGDVISNLSKSKRKLSRAYLIEPDTENYAYMMNYLEKENFRNILGLPFATHSKTQKIFFDETNNTSSRLSGHTGTEKQAIALDDLFLNNRINLIKMDIEGSELESLYGAEKVINKYKPNLAISIYHKAEDLISIYNYLFKLDLNYKFSIRTYGEQTFETILYAY
jgi:FkbM family methyltransferase